MSPQAQSFERHARLYPLFHFFALPALVVNFVWSIVRAYRAPSAAAGLNLLVAAALVALALSARRFALTVQDRVIRLEMRIRLRELLPAELRPRIHEFTVDQLVALRFAGDTELPALAASVLRDNIQKKKAIKRMVKNWQADHLRA
jgi:hypothetical protein